MTSTSVGNCCGGTNTSPSGPRYHETARHSRPHGSRRQQPGPLGEPIWPRQVLLNHATRAAADNDYAQPPCDRPTPTCGANSRQMRLSKRNMCSSETAHGFKQRWKTTRAWRCSLLSLAELSSLSLRWPRLEFGRPVRGSSSLAGGKLVRPADCHWPCCHWPCCHWPACTGFGPAPRPREHRGDPPSAIPFNAPPPPDKTKTYSHLF